ncbi:MAG: TolC family protein [Bacteroidales bacterium]|jgi:outer membrane protein TolC|nr:TolC family protein [Bacteroidales bacterium]
MNKAALILFFVSLPLSAQQPDTVRLTLNDAIHLAQKQSVDAAVALNELKTAYWEYRTYRADQLPEVNFTGTLPSYNNNYGRYQQSDGSYTYIQNNWLGLNGTVSIDQNIALTGGKISLNSSLDFTRQLGEGAYNEYMSIPFGLTFVQPVFGVNNQKWKRRIEPVRYREAQAAYVERTEEVTLSAIARFFNLLHAKENLNIARQNLQNSYKLYEIAVAKREIGYISESELMQLELSALQAKGIVTEAQSNLNACMFQLRSFLSLSEQQAIEPLVPESAPSVRLKYGEVLDKAQENNSFAKAILRRQLEADYAVASAKGNQRSINLFASVGYTGKDRTLSRTYEQLKGNQVVEVGMSIPLVDWGKRKGKVKVAESNREVILSKTKQEQMTFNQNIFLLVENFNNQAGQLEIAEQADLIAEKRYNTSIETFVIGKISVLDLNDAQKSKDEAKLKHMMELYKFWNYYYNIRSVALYDFLTNNTLDAEFEEIARQ